MIRYLEHKMIDAETNYVEAMGLSTDVKPTSGICTGSFFMEVDTGKAYFFDEDNVVWYSKEDWSAAAATPGTTETTETEGE